jgi:macrodomain Ter protein organizer (MatP/YcbG family)
MAYIIVKNVSGADGQEILIYPHREGDQIYSYSTMEETQQKLNEIQNNPIYSDCVLQIIEDNDWYM